MSDLGAMCRVDGSFDGNRGDRVINEASLKDALLALATQNRTQYVMLSSILNEVAALREKMEHIPVKGFPSVVLLCALWSTVQTACVGAGAAAGGAAQAAAGQQATFAPPKLMLFGGVDHKTYLGCLNCSEYATDSVFNQYSSYGNPYSVASIWNHYSDYGSAYSLYGACNPYATDPPVIVDHDGRYYGRLTKNVYHSEIGAGRQYVNWLAESVCQ